MPLYCFSEIAWLMKYDTPDMKSIRKRMAKIQTMSLAWMSIVAAAFGDGQGDEGDEGDAGDAVGLEAVGGRADRVAGVVAGAVGDDAGVARVVFLDVEDDLHQVGADVGDLGEDAAGDAQGRGAERFADGEAEEAEADDLRAARTGG